MTILYVAPERGGAAFAAHALHGIAPGVTLVWVRTPDAALRWLDANPESAAVIAEVDGQRVGPLLGSVRERGLTTPFIAIGTAERPDAAIHALNAGVDGYVVAGPSLESDLPRVVTLALARERTRRELFAVELTRIRAERDRAERQRSRDSRICATLQQHLFELEDAARKADERSASQAAAFADQLAARHAEFMASIANVARSRDSLAAQLSLASAELEQERQARTADAAAAVDRQREREAAFDAALREAAAATSAIEQRLTDSEAAHQQAHERAARELADVTGRQAALEERLAQEAGRSAALERQLAAAEAARADAERRYHGELAEAGEHLHTLRLLQETAVAEHASTCAALEEQLAAASAARQDVERDASAAIAAAAQREAELIERLTAESAARAVLDRELTELRTESARSRRRSRQVIAAHRRRGREQRVQLEAALATVRAEAERERRAKDEVRVELDALRQLLVTRQDELQQLHVTVDEERREHERALEASESERQRAFAAYDDLHRSFEDLQDAFQRLDRIAGLHAAERARLEAVVAERDGQLSAQSARQREQEQAAQTAYAQLDETFRQARESGAGEIARLQGELKSLRRELDASRTHAEMLRVDAERVPGLEAQLDLTRKERRREFERAPYGLCRCTPDGIITDANHTFVAMLGRRHPDELRRMEFAAAVFDCAGDLGYLLERTRTIRRAEPVETQWKTRDGRQLVVRLQALATGTGSIEIVVEDITDVRVLEQRLSQAQRMEAVGRLASEVAVTCDSLLRDVTRGAHEWLDAVGPDDGLQRHGERMLNELTRASALLRQLGVYGRQQVRALERVSAQRVLRDLAPVLKRVVGDDIQLVLSKSGGSFDVDVEAERLERVLVNVAGYARQRMPSGGQMRIDLATIAIGQRFVARHPHVRPGDHVLITVTEVPGVPAHDSGERRPHSSNVVVDLGALVDLVGSCGGHLWMEAQPAGNLVVKIHLPKPAVDAAHTSGEEARAENGPRRFARLFRSGSAVAGVRA